MILFNLFVFLVGIFNYSYYHYFLLTKGWERERGIFFDFFFEFFFGGVCMLFFLGVVSFLDSVFFFDIFFFPNQTNKKNQKNKIKKPPTHFGLAITKEERELKQKEKKRRDSRQILFKNKKNRTRRRKGDNSFQQ